MAPDNSDQNGPVPAGPPPDKKMAGHGPYEVLCGEYDGGIGYRRSQSPGQLFTREQSIRERRIAEEKARYDRGFPIAGHDFAKERSE